MLCRLCGTAYATTTDGLCDACRYMPAQPQPTVTWTCPTCGTTHRYSAPIQYVTVADETATEAM